MMGPQTSFLSATEDLMEDGAQASGVMEYRFEDDGSIPNNPTLPLLVYPQVLAGLSTPLAARSCSRRMVGAALGERLLRLPPLPFHIPRSPVRGRRLREHRLEYR